VKNTLSYQTRERKGGQVSEGFWLSLKNGLVKNRGKKWWSGGETTLWKKKHLENKFLKLKRGKHWDWEKDPPVTAYMIARREKKEN